MFALKRLQSSAIGAGGLLAIALLAGRFSGLGRELILASRFGVSARADVAVVLLTLPDMLVNLLLAGGLSAALVPRLRALPDDQALRLFRYACLWTGVIFSAIAMIIVVWPGAVFALFAPGMSDPIRWVGMDAMTLLALSVPLTALSGLTSAYLNASEKFFIAGLGTLIFNLAVIGALLAVRGNAGLFLLTAAISAGAAIRLVSQIVVLPRRVWSGVSRGARVDHGFFGAFLAGIGASSLALLPPALIRAAASLLGSGNIATINYAQKMVELPLGIFITTISTVALSRLSGHYGRGNVREAQGTLYSSLRLAILLAVMIVLFGEVLAEPVVSIIFLRGAIDNDDVGRIAALMRVILTGVPFVALSSVATAALNAQFRTSEVLRMTVASIGVLAVLAMPGLLYSSDLLLMGAVVGSQAVLAWLLAKRARICLCGPNGIANRRSLASIGSGLAVAIAFVTVARLFVNDNALFAVGLGSIGFAAAIGTSILIERR